MSKQHCMQCGGTAKLYRISAKCSDQYHQEHIGGKEYDGYVPDWIGEFGDYVEFTVCRHCGQIQSEDWPHYNKTQNQFRSGKVV